MTQQNKLIFVVIMGMAGLVVAAIFFLEKSQIYVLPTHQGIQATIQVAVPPTLEPWVNEAAKEFNTQNNQIQVKTTPLKGTEARSKLNFGMKDLPDVWIAEATFVRNYAGNVPYEVTGPTVAQDKLVWLAGSQRADLAANLNWRLVHDTAVKEMQFKIAMPPSNNIEAMAACMSVAAEYYGEANLEKNLANDPIFQRWFNELLEATPNRSRNPRDQLASRPSEADVGLLLNNEAYQLQQQGFIATFPTYNVLFNYPYLIRTSWPELSDDQVKAQQTVAKQFRDFLLSNAQQSKLGNHGFDNAAAKPTGEFVTIGQQTVQGLQWCWQ